MITIHKFALDVGQNIVPIPWGHMILTAQTQNGQIVMWALVDTGNAPQKRVIRVVGTGWELEERPGAYIATVQGAGGLVFHVFDAGKEVK